MGHGRKRVRGLLLKTALLAALITGLFAFSVNGADHEGIQRLDVRMPEAAVYYRSPNPDGKLEAYLGGEKLTMEKDAAFSETGLSADYYFLVDISGSIANFDAIKRALVRFLDLMREEDRIILLTFGDEQTVVLDGSEARSEAADKIGTLEARDKTTRLAAAVNETISLMRSNADPDHAQQVMIIISDGKPDTDHGSSVGYAQSILVQEGIEACTVTVENNQGDSVSEINEYRSSFNDLANASGGVAWTIEGADTEESVFTGLQGIRDDLMNGRRAVFKAATNRASHRREQFVLKFLTSGYEDTRDVLVSEHKADDVPPEVEEIVYEESGVFRIRFSESVIGAEEPSAWTVTCDKNEIGIKRVEKTDSSTYRLVLERPAMNGSCTIRVEGLTDDSEEENSPGEPEVSLELKEIRPEIISITVNDERNGFDLEYSESVSGADKAGNYQVESEGKKIKVRRVTAEDGKPGTSVRLILSEELRNGNYRISVSGVNDSRTGQNKLRKSEYETDVRGIVQRTPLERLIRLIVRWWPLVLTILVALILLILFLFFRRVRRNRFTVINGEVIRAENVDEKVHVEVDRLQPARRVTIWMSSGQGPAKRLDRTITGSLCVGRSSKESDIYCDDPSMSKQHFIISIERDGGLYVTDLKSTNGTRVNRMLIQGKKKLFSGDEIEAGNIRFHIKWEEEPLTAGERS